METLIDVGKKLRRRVRIVDFGIQIRVDRQKIICCHYALRSWNASHHGSWHVYGHSHGDLEHTPYFKSMDVGVDAANDHHGKGYTPFTFEEIAKIMKAREQLQHHDR
jgi:calcineurin-like phosphoesterase family protein